MHKPSRPSLSTGTGDAGTTGLIGGATVSKTHPRVEAYGTVDELNALLGLVLAEEDCPVSLREQLTHLQHFLFQVGTDLASPPSVHVPRVTEEDIQVLEQWGTAWEQQLPPLTKFILPGGSRIASVLHVARTVCRRAERYVVLLAKEGEVSSHMLVYINRLSDYLFLAARAANKLQGVEDVFA